MKNLIILSGLLFLLSLPGYSQTIFGVKAGGNLANMDFDNSFGGTYKPRVGYHFGVIAEKVISQKVFVRSELFYSLAGSRVNYDQDKSNYDLNYLNLPILLGYRPVSNLSVYLGPEVSYTLGQYGATIKFKNPFVLGIDGGVLYNLTTALAVDLRYTYGLTNIDKQHVEGFADQGREGSNRVAQLGVNYYFKRK